MELTNTIKFSPVNIEERKKWDIRPGDNIKVWYKIKEGEKTRSQVLEGLVITHKHGSEPGATFTIRKVYQGIGVEHTFPLYSPNIEKIEILSRGKTRRAKLYYIREKAAKEIRRKIKQIKREKEVLEEVKEEPKVEKELKEPETKTKEPQKEESQEEKKEE